MMGADQSSVTQGNGEGGKAIVLILVGAPGSGKTTFCNNVMKGAPRQWVRVCQDIIANGKAGTKSQCLKKTSDALKEGKSVFIDRCNLEREQRAEFIKLGGQQVDVHAVVLDLPAQLCIARSVKRTEHEGGLQGGKAAAIVNWMLQKREMPKLSEGFSRISFCHTDTDVEDSVNTYKNMGPSDNLTPGCFGQRSSDAKVQVGIMKFLKKLPPSENASICQVSDAAKVKEAIEDCNAEQLKETISSSGCVDTHVRGVGHDFPKDVSIADTYTLAFPSISTFDFHFSLEKASKIIVEKVSEFLSKTENLRLVLVDLTEESKILSKVNAKAAQRQIDPQRFFTFVGDITRLYTGGHLRCNVIANAANWRLRPGGGGVNAAIFNAAGEDFEHATKRQVQTLNPGNAVAVPLAADSPLSIREGISHVIHVLGPNMNPHRPNYLGKDYVKGCDVLQRAYSSLFESFVSIAQASKLPMERGQICMAGRSVENHIQENPDGHFKDAEQKIKREALSELEAESSKKCKGESCVIPKHDTLHGCSGCRHYSTGSSVAGPTEGVPAGKKAGSEQNKKSGNGHGKTWASWAQALHHIAMHPDENKKEVLEQSESTVVVYDLYPKAKKHLLIIARLPGLDSLADVSREHIQLLKEMQSVGLRWVQKFTSEDPLIMFRLGYHSVPSLRQLHLHVISHDFESLHLKHKKHWNSFNTPFFRDSVDVIEELENYGKVSLNEESLLSMELRCHRCRSAHPNIPRLKSHIQKCRASFPASLLLSKGRLLASSKPGSEAVC